MKRKLSGWDRWRLWWALNPYNRSVFVLAAAFGAVLTFGPSLAYSTGNGLAVPVFIAALVGIAMLAMRN
jgi:uncharacterized membrane protein